MKIKIFKCPFNEEHTKINCSGYQKSFINDEPLEICEKCKWFNGERGEDNASASDML
jgi:hypothetical protein